MANMYEGLSKEERLERICKILVTWIYRAEADDGNLIKNKKLKETYNLTQAAYRLGISKRTLQRWIKRRVFNPAIKDDGSYVITIDDIKQLELRKGVTR